MAQKQTDYTVEGRQFRTKADYARAMHDKRIMDQLRQETDLEDRAQIEKLLKTLDSGKYKFFTVLEQDFREELEEDLKKITGSKQQKIENMAQQELKRKDIRRRLIISLCCVVAAGTFGYLVIDSQLSKRNDDYNKMLSDMRDQSQPTAQVAATPEPTPQYTLDEEKPARETLEEFKNLLNIHEDLIGWLKIDDTIIDYPVVQTDDNEYYLTHNINRENDRNGTIFLDKDCEIEYPSTNLILYGHHMQSGKMFAGLEKYEDKSYWEKHPYIEFDTIYDKGIWQVMYVFRSRVYSQEEIVFKYYQFIDANSEQEFDSNMQEMASMSLYDTGVTAKYSDRLLTLSTCDYVENNGRFVIVAKKVTTKE